jgi:hypothetical protein
VLPYCYWLDRRERRYGMAPFFKHNVLTGGWCWVVREWSSIDFEALFILHCRS